MDNQKELMQKILDMYEKLQTDLDKVKVPYQDMKDKALEQKSVEIGSLIAGFLDFLYRLKKAESYLDIHFYQDNDMRRTEYDRLKNSIKGYYFYVKEMVTLIRELNRNVLAFIDRQF